MLQWQCWTNGLTAMGWIRLNIWTNKRNQHLNNRFAPASLCGVLVFDSVSRLLRLARLARLARLRPSLSHTIFHRQLFHNHLSHTTLSHTSFHTTVLCHTPSFTHHLSHTTLTHIFHTQLCHTPSFTHQLSPSLTHHLCHRPSFTHTTLSHATFHHLSHTTFVTPSFTHNFVTHHLSYTPSLTHQLCHPPSFTHQLSPSFTHHLCHTIFHFILRGMRCTWWHPPSFRVAGMALGALGWLWWRAWARWVARGAVPLCVGVALGDIHLGFAWQVWHLVTSQAWHLENRAGSGGALGRAGSPGARSTLRGRCGTWWHPPCFCVAGVALCGIHLVSHAIFLNFSILHHLLCFSFLPSPATSFVAHYWKMLTCGVIRSFICSTIFHVCTIYFFCIYIQ